MRLLYQFILSFFLMTILTLTVVGFIFNHLTQNTLRESSYEELSRFANSAKTNAEKHDKLNGRVKDSTLIEFLTTTKSVLQNQEINVYFIKKDGDVVYPGGIGKKHGKLAMTNSDWEKIESGEEVRKTLSTDFFLHDEERSFVMIPYYTTLAHTEIYGAIVVSQPTSFVSARFDPVIENLIKGFLLSSLFAFLFSYIFSKTHVRRILRLRSATREVAEGNFKERIVPHGSDELTDLAQDFNTMASSLQESQEEIERQEERRKQFMADASHEMRTPLTTVSGILEGFEYNMIPEEDKPNAIRLMKNETDRLIRLVKDNLDYEKIRTGQLSINPQIFDGQSMLEDICVQMSGKAKDVNDMIFVDTKGLKNVYADKDRFKQVVVNITNNAIQFTENGEIHLGIYEEEKRVMVSISDTGIGMSEESLKNIWERYYKADASRKNTTGESGLGLSIVQQLMKLHHGNVEVESELGVGTTFKLYFPKVDPKLHEK